MLKVVHTRFHISKTLSNMYHKIFPFKGVVIQCNPVNAGRRKLTLTF